MKQPDVRVGGATLPRHVDGGWALPGREVTYSQIEAVEIASEMAKLMGESAPMATRTAESVKTRFVAQVVRRTVDPSKFRPVHSLV